MVKKDRLYMVSQDKEGRSILYLTPEQLIACIGIGFEYYFIKTDEYRRNYIDSEKIDIDTLKNME